MAPTTLLLSSLLRSEVRSAEGAAVGRLLDLTIDFGEQPDRRRPVVRRVVIGRHGRIGRIVPWNEVIAIGHDLVQLAAPGGEPTDPAHGGELPDELLLARDVLDTQVVDVAGKRLARVADVILELDDAVLRVFAVDIGSAGLWRRLGPRRVGVNAPVLSVDWDDLHLTSAHGHALQLAMPGTGVHRLAGAQLSSVVAILPTDQAVEVLDAVSPLAAAGALSASHPRVGARLVRAMRRERASSVVEHMPVDDATAVLRGLPPEAVDRVLGNLVSDRAATLRRLLAHPADTAGGLMNTDIRTARVGEAVEAIRDRVAADQPELEGAATVFVVDDDGRPVGSYQPTDLLNGRATAAGRAGGARHLARRPRRRPLRAAGTTSALPVVDADGRLIGMVAIDDVLEELLAERLPGQGRFARVRRRRSWLGGRQAKAAANADEH